MRIRIIDDYRYLKEMADGLAEIKKKLRDSSDQIRQNLMQIFLWRDTTTVHHWESELYAACHKVSLCRNTKKFPKKNIILQELWLYWEDCFTQHLKHYVIELEVKEANDAPKFNPQNLYNYLNDYYNWAAELLCSEGWIDFDQIEQKIQELVNKYKLL